MTGWHVLILDDDLVAATVTQYGLDRLLGPAVKATIANNPSSAWLQDNYSDIDLVIVDPNPQRRATLIFIQELREHQPDIPIVALTAYDTPRLRREMQTLGIQHYLTKPIDLVQLVEEVRMVLKFEQPIRRRAYDQVLHAS